MELKFNATLSMKKGIQLMAVVVDSLSNTTKLCHFRTVFDLWTMLVLALSLLRIRRAVKVNIMTLYNKRQQGRPNFSIRAIQPGIS